MQIELNHILLPTDLSEASLPATRYAVQLARQFNSTLHLLYVMEEPVYYAHWADISRNATSGKPMQIPDLKTGLTKKMQTD